MLPKLVHMKPVLSRCGRLTLVVSALSMLGLPTFHGVAQSQEAVKPSQPAAPVVDKVIAPDSNSKNAAVAVDKKPTPKVNQINRPIEEDLARLIGQFNELLKQKRYAEAAQIADKARAVEEGRIEVESLPRYTAEDARIVRTLDGPTAFDFEDVPLSDVVKELAQQHQINIVIDYGAFRPEESPKAIHTASLKVREVSLKNALKLLLDSVQMTYMVEESTLKIVPVEAVYRKTVTRIYPVQDLVGESSDFESLIMAIRQSVARGSWDTAGNGVTESSIIMGGISKVPASGSLVIHHNYQVHQEVLDLLRGLREAKRSPAKQ